MTEIDVLLHQILKGEMTHRARGIVGTVLQRMLVMYGPIEHTAYIHEVVGAVNYTLNQLGEPHVKREDIESFFREPHPTGRDMLYGEYWVGIFWGPLADVNAIQQKYSGR